MKTILAREVSSLGVIAVVLVAVFFSPRPLSADSFNWQSVNGVNWNSPVKSQWGGTCWDYGTCSELEAKYMLTRNDPNFAPMISDQQMPWDPPWNSFPLQAGMTGFEVNPQVHHGSRPRLRDGMPAGYEQCRHSWGVRICSAEQPIPLAGAPISLDLSLRVFFYPNVSPFQPQLAAGTSVKFR